MSKPSPNAGKFKYDSKGNCENPELLLAFETTDCTYSLMIAETNTGWIIGYLLDYTKRVPEERAVKAAGEFYGSKTAASQAVAEIAWGFFGADLRGDDKQIKEEFLPLYQLLKDLESPLITIIKNQPNMATKKKDAKKHPPKPPPGDKKKTNNLKAVKAAAIKPDITIQWAKIKDDFCHYGYKINEGQGAGFIHKVEGKGIIDQDMRDAFEALHVHLAAKDDIFKHANIEIASISTMHNHELTGLYQVAGFKMKGGPESEAIILEGNKYLTLGDRMEIKTPKIMIDNLSSYKWYNELKEASDLCREEVQLYHGGKYTEPDKDDEGDGGAKQKGLFDKDADNDGEDINTGND